MPLFIFHPPRSTVSLSEIDPNDQSAFFRFVLRNVFFSQLRIHKSTRGAQQTKRKFSSIIPEFSITVQKSKSRGGRFQGLPIPLAVFPPGYNYSADDRFPPLWVFGYHNTREIEALVLFPCSNVANRRKDRTGKYLADYNDFDPFSQRKSTPFLHSLEIRTLYIWPRLIRIKELDSAGLKHVLDIPENFLFLSESDFNLDLFEDAEVPYPLFKKEAGKQPAKKRKVDIDASDSYTIEGFEGVNLDEEAPEVVQESRKVDIEKFMAEEKPFFNLYYDSTPCLIFIKCRFEPRRHFYPKYNISSKGIVWTRTSEYKQLHRYIRNWKEEQDTPEWWLKDS